jgi:hypothetical protein
MATGTLAMALLLLAAGTDATEVVPMNKREFKIPVQPLSADQRALIKELVLYSSADQGVTWNAASFIAPDKEGFKFFAPADGMYWFNLVVIDSKGNREPNDLYKTPPRYKVLVDTLKPTVRIVSAMRKGDDIEVRWEIQEDHPDLNTLKLDYWTTDPPTGLWYSAAVKPALSGTGSFRFTNSGPVTVRVQMMDQAGNLGSDQFQIAARENPPAVVQASAPATVTNPVASIPAPSSSTLGGPALGSAGTPVPPAPMPFESPARAQAPAPAGLRYERSPTIQQTALTQGNESRTNSDRIWGPAPQAGAPQTNGYGSDGDNRLATAAANAGGALPAGAPAATTRWPGGPPIRTQITNTTQVSLDYETTNVGPSGIGSVELYLTRDEGRTWERYANDDTLKPPMLVNLPGEGVFGLRLVVGSRAGLGRRPPQPGDLPDLRVEVDITPPLAKLYYPQADPRRRDALLLTWSAKDNNPLPPNAVTLQWAGRPDGPWQTIAADLANTGQYSWQLAKDLSYYRVYLRLSVRDAAGNVTVDESPEAVLIDLHEPEGHLLGITGSSRKP